MKKIKRIRKKAKFQFLKDKRKQLSHFDLGINLLNNRQYDKAIECFRQALDSNPNLIHAWNYMGNAYQEKKQFEKSIGYYQQAIQIDPTDPTAYINLGIAFQNSRQSEEAIKHFRIAIDLNPNLYQAYSYMGLSLAMDNNFEEAVECYLSALSLNPDSPMTLVNLGYILSRRGDLDGAEAVYRRALHIDPNDLQAAEALAFNMLYNTKYATGDIFYEHLRIAKRFAEPLSKDTLPYANERTVARKLRIGYVSPDFKRHPVASFIEPVLAAHNKEDVEVFCYSNVALPDEITARIQNYADRWRDISSISDEMAADMIRKDGIDILVDLAGHTANNRILLFARKPAPVQVTWIGYPPTTGLSSIDYKIVDGYTDPTGMTERFYSEKLMRLPESFVCYQPDTNSPEVGPLPATRNGRITFGSFNNFQKITQQAFDLWSEVLNTVPGSRLVLKSKIFSDNTARRYAVDMFLTRGVAEDQIILESADPPPKHLESYGSVDIGLDTFPFNGLTTTCEAMWMGVPVITLQGSGYAARAGVSLLSNVGLTELIARTPDDYVSIAAELAEDTGRLEHLRARLRGMMASSPLCNAKRFTCNLEVCYREMWERWCKYV